MPPSPPRPPQAVESPPPPPARPVGGRRGAGPIFMQTVLVAAVAFPTVTIAAWIWLAAGADSPEPEDCTWVCGLADVILPLFAAALGAIAAVVAGVVWGIVQAIRNAAPTEGGAT